MHRGARLILMVSTCLAILPAAAYAQASITGVVRDTSGAVLPGVTVEAASPALIERVRVVVTDGTGQYRVENLRPGSYTVTFTLPGFATVRREGIELTGTFTATVNAEVRVGGVEETVTVTGEPMLVDVQSATVQRVMNQEILDATPINRNVDFIAALVPAARVGNQDVGGIRGQGAAAAGAGDLSIHGSSDVRIFVSGLSIQSGAGGVGPQAAPNLATYQEVVVDTSGISAEQKEGGMRISLIPRDGGNAFRGYFVGAFANGSMQSNNFSQDLKDRGLPAPDSLQKIWDLNPAFGGPIRQDTLWFFSTIRYNGVVVNVPMFQNKNAGNPDVWTFEPDLTRPATRKNIWRNGVARITWQATRRNKIAFAYDQMASCECPRTLPPTTSPESALNSYAFLDPKRLVFGEWTAPVTNRLLFEAAALHHSERGSRLGRNIFFPPSVPERSMIPVLEQSINLTYRAEPGGATNSWNTTFFYRTAVSYVTGAHALKAGFNHYRSAQDQVTPGIDAPMLYRFNNGVPNRVTLRAWPTYGRTKIPADIGVFVQERWTKNRLTLTGGLRYDYFHSVYPEETVGPGRFVPNRNIVFPETDGVRWHELQPRSGLAYDVFGDGKTAVKASLGKYVGFRAARGIFNELRPSARVVASANRSWNDANRNFVPDCDLLAPAANGECGALDNRAFGSTQPGVAYDPEWMRGWNKGDYNWALSAGVQRQVASGVSVDVSYFRRWFGNFLVTDDRAVAPSDFDPFTITAPADSRLPNGGGYVIPGLYDLKPAAFGRPADGLVTFADNFGKQTEHWNGVDVTLSARPRVGVLLQGGTSTGRRTADNCDVVTKVDNPSPLYCRQQGDFLTNLKLLATYTIPRIDVQLAGNYQNMPGPEITANYVAPLAAVLPSLGRPLAGGANNVTVNIVEPRTIYGDRINQLDLRIGKILRFGSVRTTASLDVYNTFNGNPVLSLSNSFANWQQPQEILQPRFLKISVQLDF